MKKQINIRADKELFYRFKAYCAQKQTTFQDFFIEKIEQEISSKDSTTEQKPTTEHKVGFDEW
jgi:hypothetical protein